MYYQTEITDRSGGTLRTRLVNTQQQRSSIPNTGGRGGSVEGVQWFGVGESQGVGHRRLGDLAAPHGQAVLQTPIGSYRFDWPKSASLST